ncbi:unnamed protein product [Rhizophagus irregularis]|uniref:MACPF domain-containing protein n=2 Tax=Rhizophagus irregularis TaxID=588596 RepID=A0A916E579_9GLOM|nr:unnamed protein product [Rhizophagus irregularis]CAB5208991.1 unnamed protein product [Rhizophagus irregularis]CAB5361467.1 unnamed protein product [Rhizophagus irregularis]
MSANFNKMSKSLTLKNNFFTAVKIKVRKDGLDSEFICLKLGENLSNIRQELEKTHLLINDTLLFAKGTSEIQRKSEKDFFIDEIIEEIGDDKFINLKKNPSHDYDLKILKDELKLEYGRKIISDGNIKIAKKKAFILNVKDFEVCKEKGIGTERREFNSSEYNESITELTLNGDINAQGFAKFGLSYGKSKNGTSEVEKITICHYTYVDKISLKFKSDEKKIWFEPTEEFKDEIENAIKIDMHRERLNKFKDITEKFGQFISNEVLIGGRAYFLKKENLGKFSKKKNKNFSTIIEAMSSNAGITYTSGKLTENANCSKVECFKLIGGRSYKLKNFNESIWIKSLVDFKNWDCIEYKNPVSIFQLLPNELRKRIFKSIGKRILYNDPGEVYTYKPNKGNGNAFNLKNIPTYIADIIKEGDAECNIFATVIDTGDSKKVFFNCQILWTPNRNPRLIIHCNKNSNKEYNLKIGLMVVGYDINFDFINSDSNIHFEVKENKIKASKSMYYKKILILDDSFTEEYKEYEEHICLGIPVLRELKPSLDSLVIGHHFFNYQKNNRIGTYTFSYCLEKNQYVELPEFTFHTLIISNYHNFDKCNEYPSNQVKYTSLHSSEDNCAPIFLKQEQNKIRIKYMNCKENTCTCICKKTLKDDHELHSLIILKTPHENNWKILRA